MYFKLKKRNAGLSTENVLPYTQLNSEAINAVSGIVNQLQVLIEKKKSYLQILSSNTGNMTQKAVESIHSISMIEEILQLYNTAVEPYMGLKASLTQQSKGAILTNIRSLMSSIGYLVNGIKTCLNQITGVTRYRDHAIKYYI